MAPADAVEQVDEPVLVVRHVVGLRAALGARIGPTLSRTVAVITRNSETLLPAGRALVELLAESLRAFARRRGARAAGH